MVDLSIETGNQRIASGDRAPGFVALVAAATVLVAAFAAPSGLFTVDEYFYVRMAEAFAHDGRLDFLQMRIDAPPVSMAFAFPADGGRLVPQYPSGYAIMAAPFYAVAGVKGLIFLNALAFAATLLLTARIMRQFGADQRAANEAVAILALCTYASSYAFAVWPHMVSTAITAGVASLVLSRKGRARMAAAGLLAGLACAVRIDAVVLAPAVLIWLRAAGIEDSRRLFAAFGAGFLVGVAAAAALSFAKSGTINPFTYQNSFEQNDPAKFIGAAAVVLAALAVMVLFDIRKAAGALASNKGASAALAIAALIAVLSLEEAKIFAGGVWTFVVDQQAFAFWKTMPGIERDDFGFLVFFGAPKKALLQSMPFAAIVVASLARMFSPDPPDRKAMLLLLCAAGYVGLYALNQTDAGLSFNQRFLTPTLPFVAVLSALELARLRKNATLDARISAYAAAAGFAGALGLLVVTIGKAPASSWAEYYFPLAVALVVVLSAFASQRAQSGGRTMRNAAYALVAALGVSGAVSAYDLGRTLIFRAIAMSEEARLSKLAAADSLILTDRLTVWPRRAGEDLSVVYWPILDKGSIGGLIEAFTARGHAVYTHGALPADMLPEGLQKIPVEGASDLASGPFERVSARSAE